MFEQLAGDCLNLCSNSLGGFRFEDNFFLKSASILLCLTGILPVFMNVDDICPDFQHRPIFFPILTFFFFFFGGFNWYAQCGQEGRVRTFRCRERLGLPY